MGTEIDPILRHRVALEALQKSVSNFEEVLAELRLLSAGIISDHHTEFQRNLDALDAIAGVMRRTVEEFADDRKK